MSSNTIDAKMLSKMFLTGAKSLEARKAWINELNVFPVPDGDTGTNMTLTIMTAAKDVAAMGRIEMEPLCKAIASGSLRGARGNSGVILSQLLRGFTKGVRDKEYIDIPTLASSCNKAVETAYKAVMKPKEGTILTVARGVAEKATELCDTTEDMSTFIEELIKHAEHVLSRTPEMLPVLKQAGVVDSGGQGLVEILKGAYQAYLGNEVVFSAEEDELPAMTSDRGYEVQANFEIKYGYCTEFIVMLDKVFNAKNEQDFKNFLETIGDSIVCVADEDYVKVHVHTNDPGLAIQKALTYGALSRIKIDNMREEHQEKLFKMSKNSSGQTTYEEISGKTPQDNTDNNEKVRSRDDMREITGISDMMGNKKNTDVNDVAGSKDQAETGEHKNIGFISVSMGDGLNGIFKGLGVDRIISGGQTMNPSTEDMLRAVNEINADNIFILPNNKNIIMAANQVKYMVEDKKIYVIPTKTIPQGITALINYTSDMSADDNEEAMNRAIADVKTGQVTYAVRDTVINNIEIKQGNIMGIGDKEILAVGDIVEDTALKMIDNMVSDTSELISIYYGRDTDEQDAGDFLRSVEGKFPQCDVEMHFGGQPIYYYVVSVE
ncbi:MAG: DAK2 domain-containing protein [Lachnospiraceae bacterium]|nr:DAK2 domain-containing protein [Lachnospiraceae bacterium]